MDAGQLFKYKVNIDLSNYLLNNALEFCFRLLYIRQIDPKKYAYQYIQLTNIFDGLNDLHIESFKKPINGSFEFFFQSSIIGYSKEYKEEVQKEITKLYQQKQNEFKNLNFSGTKKN
jgi:hypothetical protein